MTPKVERTLFWLALAVELAALAGWAACVAGHADPVLKIMIGCVPLVLIATGVSLYMALVKKRWWALPGVLVAMWAYAPVIGLVLLGLNHGSAH